MDSLKHKTKGNHSGDMSLLLYLSQDKSSDCYDIGFDFVNFTAKNKAVFEAKPNFTFKNCLLLIKI